MDVSRAGSARLLKDSASGRPQPNRIAPGNGSVLMLRPLPRGTTSAPLNRRIERKRDEVQLRGAGGAQPLRGATGWPLSLRVPGEGGQRRARQAAQCSGRAASVRQRSGWGIRRASALTCWEQLPHARGSFRGSRLPPRSPSRAVGFPRGGDSAGPCVTVQAVVAGPMECCSHWRPCCRKPFQSIRSASAALETSIGAWRRIAARSASATPLERASTSAMA